MSIGKYILDDDGKAIPCESLQEWGEWMESEDRTVAWHFQENANGQPLTVSTVFLGLDHQWIGGPPLLWETMIFGGDEDDDGSQWRYASRDEALANHNMVVACMKKKYGIQ